MRHTYLRQGPKQNQIKIKAHFFLSWIFLSLLVERLTRWCDLSNNATFCGQCNSKVTLSLTRWLSIRMSHHPYYASPSIGHSNGYRNSLSLFKEQWHSSENPTYTKGEYSESHSDVLKSSVFTGFLNQIVLISAEGYPLLFESSK